jgi:hypothetical protein
MPAYSWSEPAVAAFVVIPMLLCILFALGVGHAWRRSGASRSATARAVTATVAGCAGWMAITAAIADTGVLRAWDRNPPPFMLLVLGIGAIAAAIVLSPLGRRLAHYLPLWSLVAVQIFRLPLELAMHDMYERGIMPVQMSYAGRNLDIVTGVTAIVVAGLVARRRSGRAMVMAWNVFGLVLLANIVAIAILSTPRFRYFGDQQLNVWVTYPPFVWLPTVMVLTALAGHLLIFRALGART